MRTVSTTSFLSFLYLLTSTAAANGPHGNAVVLNHCADNIYISSVGGSMSPIYTVAPGDIFSEPIHRDPVSGGVAIKITRTANGLFNGSPQTDYAYTLDGNTVWYDLSDVFGDPFAGAPISISPANEQCPCICWPNGVNPGGSQVKNCAAGGDIVLTVCASGC